MSADDAKQTEQTPEPIKDADDATVAADDAGNVKGGFNPQPDPPGIIRRLNPQIDPPTFHAPNKIV